VTHAGVCGSKNVGTSNRNAGEIPARRKIKVSLAMVIIQGLVGPKGMAKAELDGQQVNIPVLFVYAMEGRRVVYKADYWISVWAMRVLCRQIRTVLKAPSKWSINVWVRPDKFYKARFRENFLSSSKQEPVPQTDTGDQVE
jgi:hypothetical protein